MMGWVAAAVNQFFFKAKVAVNATGEAGYPEEVFDPKATGTHGRHGNFVARGRSFYGKTSGTRAAMREAKINRRWLAKQPK